MAPQPTITALEARRRCWPWRPSALKKYLPGVFFLKKFIHDFSGPGGFRERARICDDSAKHDRTGNAAVLRFV